MITCLHVGGHVLARVQLVQENIQLILFRLVYLREYECVVENKEERGEGDKMHALETMNPKKNRFLACSIFTCKSEKVQ